MTTSRKSHSSATSEYLHGTDPEEQARLARLNDMLNDASLRELQLLGGEHILDVGCGLGQFSRAMARAAGPGGRVVAIDRSEAQLREAHRLADEAGEKHLVEIRHGDAVDLPLNEHEWNSFDVVHTRFLLEHVSEPIAVVRAMLRAARAGGRIILEDDHHDTMRLWPEPPGFAPLWQAYIRTYDKLGNDPYIGHRLVALLHEAGATPVRNTWIFFGSCAGQLTFLPLVENLIGLLEGAREKMLSSGSIDGRYFDDGVAALREWATIPYAAMWFAFAWAEGRRPEK